MAAHDDETVSGLMAAVGPRPGGDKANDEGPDSGRETPGDDETRRTFGSDDLDPLSDDEEFEDDDDSDDEDDAEDEDADLK